MGLWTSLFVLSTLLINAPTIPALLHFTGLAAVPPVKLRIREKAKHALLRYTAAAIKACPAAVCVRGSRRLSVGHAIASASWATIHTCMPLESVLQDLKADEDEMLRGVDWGAVQRYVDLSGELQMFSTRGGGGSSGSGGGTDVRQHTLDDGEGAAEGRPALHRRFWQQQQHWGQPSASLDALQRDEDLFEGVGWGAPSSPRSSASGRQAEALADMGCADAALLPASFHRSV